MCYIITACALNVQFQPVCSLVSQWSCSFSLLPTKPRSQTIPSPPAAWRRLRTDRPSPPPGPDAITVQLAVRRVCRYCRRDRRRQRTRRNCLIVCSENSNLFGQATPVSRRSRLSGPLMCCGRSGRSPWVCGRHRRRQRRPDGSPKAPNVPPPLQSRAAPGPGAFELSTGRGGATQPPCNGFIAAGVLRVDLVAAGVC